MSSKKNKKRPWKHSSSAREMFKIKQSSGQSIGQGSNNLKEKYCMMMADTGNDEKYEKVDQFIQAF